VFLTSELDGEEWSALPPGEGDTYTHWPEIRVSPRTGLDAVTKRKKSLILPWIVPRSSSP